MIYPLNDKIIVEEIKKNKTLEDDIVPEEFFQKSVGSRFAWCKIVCLPTSYRGELYGGLRVLVDLTMIEVVEDPDGNVYTLVSEKNIWGTA